MSVTIRAVGMRVTGRAMMIDLDGTTHWLPKSQIITVDGNLPHTITRFTGNDLQEFVVSDWIAREKGFVLEEEIFTVKESGIHDNQPFAVTERGNIVVCWCPNRKDADIIAAALNLTQSKG